MLKLHWFLPTGGDARDVLPDADDPHRRPPALSYLAQVATACDALGFDVQGVPVEGRVEVGGQRTDEAEAVAQIGADLEAEAERR